MFKRHYFCFQQKQTNASNINNLSNFNNQEQKYKETESRKQTNSSNYNNNYNNYNTNPTPNSNFYTNQKHNDSPFINLTNTSNTSKGKNHGYEDKKNKEKEKVIVSKNSYENLYIKEREKEKLKEKVKEKLFEDVRQKEKEFTNLYEDSSIKENNHKPIETDKDELNDNDLNDLSPNNHNHGLKFSFSNKQLKDVPGSEAKKQYKKPIYDNDSSLNSNNSDKINNKSK